MQDREYFLNTLPFATLKSCGLFPFVKVSELLLLSSLGSSRQSSCEYLQLHLISPSTVHGGTGMNQNISWMNAIPATVVEYDSLTLLTFEVNKTSIWHSIVRVMLSQLCWILSCISVEAHFHCFCRRHQEIQLFSTVLWVARIEVSLAATWVVSPACWELSNHHLLEKLPLKHIWKTCSNTGTVSCFVTNLSVPEGFCTLYAL